MTHLGYILSGWGVVVGALGAYAFRTIVRGRTLTRMVPAERRRWLDSGRDEAS